MPNMVARGVSGVLMRFMGRIRQTKGHLRVFCHHPITIKHTALDMKHFLSSNELFFIFFFQDSQ
jgi:hypothetical protein